jgi:hypothetical protein
MTLRQRGANTETVSFPVENAKQHCEKFWHQKLFDHPTARFSAYYAQKTQLVSGEDACHPRKAGIDDFDRLIPQAALRGSMTPR